MLPIEIVDKQTEVVKLQADIINELFLLLAQHITSEELEQLSVIDKINMAVVLCNEIRMEVV